MVSKAVFLLFLFSSRLVGAVDNEDAQNGDEPPQAFNLNDMMGARSCPNFKCTGGLAVAPKSRAVKFDSYGCDGMSGGLFNMGGGANSDDGDEKKPYASCCDQWHACYQICGASKETCDSAYTTCTGTVCGAEDDKCKQDAKIGFVAIQIAGCEKYDQAQYKACECVPKGKVGEKRETVIRNFYKKHAPESIDKAADLAKKADTAAKMAGLLKKLIQKYPESIQQKEDPKKKEMDEMMKKTRENVKIVEDTGEDSTEDEEETGDEKIEL
jgi:hypothetical protein